MFIASSICFFLAGLCKAFIDTINYHYPISVFPQDNVGRFFWDNSYNKNWGAKHNKSWFIREFFTFLDGKIFHWFLLGQQYLPVVAFGLQSKIIFSSSSLVSSLCIMAIMATSTFIGFYPFYKWFLVHKKYWKPLF